MKFTSKLLATRMIAAAGAVPVALALSATAAAEPAASPPIPAVPGLPLVDQLAAVPANAPQLLQNVASALTGAPATPVAPPPTASAAVTLPQPAAAPAQPATLPVATTPGALPAATTPATGPGALVPTGEVNLPQVPFLPVPLPQQVSFPGDLTYLLPPGTPLAGLAPKPATPIAAPAATVPGAAVPAAAPAAPGTAGLAPVLLPLAGLP
jgi:hypothetical protein